eukprot:TRINITY_DN68134_c0_g1_i1.p1 TRINITY_DN68134_c0_g1~~TRINITY_DN68134_c0_g1_i1.p1  ORF type:complete len:487 (-),score=125.47 TRINITY_DN68134_c0_g1_i1:522-1982(-)
MAETCGLDPEESRVCEGEYPPSETPLETPWTFWYDKKTTDRKESDQYMEGLRQLGTFNTVQGFYQHYSYLNRPSDLPRDHNLLLFRRGYKPMWEEFPEGGCWIIRIKRKVSLNYVNRMWENLLLACIGEVFDLPDVAGCVLSTRVKDDVLSVWNVSNAKGHAQARFRIGEKLMEVLDLDMNALIQYKDHMQSLQDYSTYRNAKNYMFAPSPTVTPLQSALETPLQSIQDGPSDMDFDALPPAAMDDMLPGAAIDSEAFFGLGGDDPAGLAAGGSLLGSGKQTSPKLSAQSSPWPSQAGSRGASSLPSSKARPLPSASAPAWEPTSKTSPTPAGAGRGGGNGDTAATTKGNPDGLSPSAAPWYPAGVEAFSPPSAQARAEKPKQVPGPSGKVCAVAASRPTAPPSSAGAGESKAAARHDDASAPASSGTCDSAKVAENTAPSQKSWASIAAAAGKRGSGGPPAKAKAGVSKSEVQATSGTSKKPTTT